MALWPFRNKSRRRRPRNTAVSSLDGSGGRAPYPTPAPTAPGSTDAPESPSLATPSRENRKLHRRSRAPTHDSTRAVQTKKSGRAATRAPPPSRPSNVASGAGPSRYSGAGPDNVNVVNALPDDPFWQPPTLHSKRDAEHLAKRTPSKRRRKNPEREAEIKAMSSFVPMRPAAEDWTTGRPIRKETRRLPRTSFGWKGKRRHEWDREQQRISAVSLPMPESIHSSMSSDSEPLAFEVSAFDSLRPRPTLRYASNPKMSGSPESGPPGVYRRPHAHRGMLSSPVPEATIKAHKRIDDLANELSASDLRELMERDQRRRDRRKQRDQEKLEKKLERRVEQQKEAETRAAEEGRDSPPNMERGVFGREARGLGADPASAVVTSSRQRPASPKSSKQLGKLPERPEDVWMEDDQGRATSPLHAFHRTDSIPLEVAAELVEQEEPEHGDLEQSEPEQSEPDQNEPEQSEPEQSEPEQPVAASPSSPGLRGLLRLRKSRSKSPMASSGTRTTDLSEIAQKKSTDSISKGTAWSSFLKWANKNRRRSAGPSFFSNASRDSMQTPQACALPSEAALRRLSSTMPKRTRSRFREDLPELPLSPPASPTVNPIPSTIAEASPDRSRDGEEEIAAQESRAARHDTPTSGYRSDPRGPTPSSMGGQQDEPGFSPEPHTLSLASIDSEASWLSGGRPGRKRQSSRSGIYETAQPRRESVGSSAEPHHGRHTPEAMSIAEDGYLARFSPGSAASDRHSAGEVLASSDDEDEDGQTTHKRWGSVRGKRPVMVHSGEGMKSREGLVNAGQEARIETVPETEDGVA